MKKVLVWFFVFCLCVFQNAYAKCNCSSKGHHHGNCPHSNYYSTSHQSNPVYLVRSDVSNSKENFADCKKHYKTVETITNYYSDGTKRVFVKNTIHNEDGSVLVSDCSSVNHIINAKKHYFAICKNRGGCSIINEDGNNITKRTYSRLFQLSNDRFLVKYDKKYGIIDLFDNIIVPIKYQRFEKVGENVFITKLNGYFGLLDINNKTLIKNNCEKIKPLYETILVKRYGKYGLYDINGKVLYDVKYDKIKKLGEYILIKKDKNYIVVNSSGYEIDRAKYKKIKLDRNTLYGYTNDNEWVNIAD